MKKIFICVLVALVSLDAVAQLGGWFKWQDTTYVPTGKDYAEVVYGINTNRIRNGVWYNFSNGKKYQVLHPVEWRNLLLECYQIIDNTTTVNNLAERLEDSESVVWGEDLPSKTKNYYFGKNGTIKFVPDYLGKGLPVLVWDGAVVLKRSCGNPQGNEIVILKTPTPTPAPATPAVVTPTQVDVNVTVEIVDQRKDDQQDYQQVVEQPAPQDVCYPVGYDDYGQEIFFNRFLDLLLLYNRSSGYYETYTWQQAYTRGFYSSWSDYSLRMNRSCVGYSNQTIINNYNSNNTSYSYNYIDNSVRNSNNYGGRRVSRPEPKPNDPSDNGTPVEGGGFETPTTNTGTGVDGGGFKSATVRSNGGSTNTTVATNTSRRNSGNSGNSTRGNTTTTKSASVATSGAQSSRGSTNSRVATTTTSTRQNQSRTSGVNSNNTRGSRVYTQAKVVQTPPKTSSGVGYRSSSSASRSSSGVGYRSSSPAPRASSGGGGSRSTSSGRRQ